MRFTVIQLLAVVSFPLLAASSVSAEQMLAANHADDSLVLHYRFDQDPGETAVDLSDYGNDGQIIDGQYLAEVDGRRGVLRFNGETAYIDCGNSESMLFYGDVTFEMWARSNNPTHNGGAYLNWGNKFSFLAVGAPVTQYSNGNDTIRMKLADENILPDGWAHIAVVVEYPRFLLYRNGRLISDEYMPFPAIEPDDVARLIGSKCAIDLDEVRVYRRALTAREVLAHARGREIDIPCEEKIRVDTHWYENTVKVHLSVKGAGMSGYTVELKLLNGDRTNAVTPQHLAFVESNKGSRRYVVTAAFSLDGLEGRSLDAVARITDQEGDYVQTVCHHVSLVKPQWVDTPEGSLTDVPAPWTPVRAEAKAGGSVQIDVWGRMHMFGRNLFPERIEVKGAEILDAPVMLHARADGDDVRWRDVRVKLGECSDIAAMLNQSASGGSVSLAINTVMEFDGYAIFECTITAERETTLDSLILEIPMRSERATLCFGTDVYEQQTDPLVPMSVLHMGAVDRDLAFRFSPNIWLGDEEIGLTWQAESNEDWRYDDVQKAIEILPRGDTTYLHANWINVPTKLNAGEVLHYKFALQATPVKPMLRDSWDLRILRNDPYTGSKSDLYTDSTGNNLDLNLPDRWVDIDHEIKDRIYSTVVPDLYRMESGPGRMPALAFYRNMGTQHLWINTHDNWPWPMPSHPVYARQLHRLIDRVHAEGLKVYGYQIHERMPTNVPEYDIHGEHMTVRPIRPYEWATAFCAKSRAAQDAILHAMGERLDQFGDDGIYLDGTGVHLKSCQNTVHGCGYHPRDGAINLNGSTVFDQSDRGSDASSAVYPTYPVFSERKFIQRLYIAIKQRRPHGIVDVHSWYLNSAGLAYADVLWTGEQWWHLKGKGTEYVIDELPLDAFRTMFMGYQIGVPAEVLAYRLISQNTPCRKIAAISLLHDIPVRARVQNTEWLHIISKLWQVRDAFGAKQAEKLFYWNNQDVVNVPLDRCYATLLKHPANGTLAIVSNLRHETAVVNVHFNLDELGLSSVDVIATDVLTDKTTLLAADGTFSTTLKTHDWVYLWLKPRE